MNNIRERIIRLITHQIGVREAEVLDDADINRDLGCSGDDFSELMEAFAKEFQVDITGYSWYFHTEEEGGNWIGGSFFAPPNERVQHIPVTLNVLLDSAKTGKWMVVYPEHQLPKRRYDLLINLLLVVVLVGYGIYAFLKWLL